MANKKHLQYNNGTDEINLISAGTINENFVRKVSLPAGTYTATQITEGLSNIASPLTGSAQVQLDLSDNGNMEILNCQSGGGTYIIDGTNAGGTIANVEVSNSSFIRFNNCNIGAIRITRGANVMLYNCTINNIEVSGGATVRIAGNGTITSLTTFHNSTVNIDSTYSGTITNTVYNGGENLDLRANLASNISNLRMQKVISFSATDFYNEMLAKSNVKLNENAEFLVPSGSVAFGNVVADTYITYFSPAPAGIYINIEGIISGNSYYTLYLPTQTAEKPNWTPLQVGKFICTDTQSAVNLNDFQPSLFNDIFGNNWQTRPGFYQCRGITTATPNPIPNMNNTYKISFQVWFSNYATIEISDNESLATIKYSADINITTQTGTDLVPILRSLLPINTTNTRQYTGEFFNGQPVYKQRFNGTITVAAQTQIATTLTSGVGTIVNYGGMVFDGFNYIQLGYKGSVNYEAALYRTGSGTTGTLVMDSRSNVARTNAPYVIWASYTLSI